MSRKDILNLLKVLAVLAFVSLLGMSYYSWLRSLPQRYTVGEIYELRKPARGNLRAVYKYKIDGEEHKNDINIKRRDRDKLIGRRYIVSVPEDHNGSGRLLWDYPVKSNVEAPIDGWKILPEKSRFLDR